MLDELKKLKQLQKTALAWGDFATLNAVNKQIFEIREQLQKLKEKEKQIEKDNKLANKIDIICKL